MSDQQTIAVKRRTSVRGRQPWRSRRALWSSGRWTIAATFLIGCFFLGGSFDRITTPSRKSGFILEDAGVALGLGVLLFLLIWALVEAGVGLFRKLLGMP